SRGVLLQPLHEHDEGAGRGDGRLLSRVPEHRRAQLHVGNTMPKVLPASSSGSGHRARGRRVSTTLAEINVIPLVDVMLVLLIIFMIAAPMLQRGVEVSLPVARRSPPIASERLFIDVPFSFRQDRRVFLLKEPIRL